MLAHRLLGVAGALAVLAGAPAVAEASSVTLEGSTWVVRADAGLPNTMRIAGPNSGSGGEWWFRDVAGDGEAQWQLPPECRNIAGSGMIECPLRGGGVRVESGDGNDVVTIEDNAPPGEAVTVQTGEGVDRINARSTGTVRDSFDAGGGDDTLNGNERPELLDGGPGNDTLAGNGGADEVRGGDGNDKLSGDAYGAPAADVLDGGPGIDKLENEWVPRAGEAHPAIAVTLDGAANDGRPGENDDVVGVEDVYSTAAASLTAGADPVTFKVFNTPNASSTLVGGPANDTLTGFDWHDTITGNAGDDAIEGGYGNDTITPGPGRDTVVADAVDGCNFLQCRQPQGNDTVNVRDNEVDNVDCGVGADTVVADPADVIGPSCETVDRGTPPAQQAPKKKKASKRCVVPKLKQGSKLASARTKLRKANCKVSVRKVRSKVRKGRVVGLSVKTGRKLRTAKAGRKLRSGTTIYVRVSKGR